MPHKINNEHNACVASNYAGDNVIVWCPNSAVSYTCILYDTLSLTTAYMPKNGRRQDDKVNVSILLHKNAQIVVRVCVGGTMNSSRNWQSAYSSLRHRGEDRKRNGVRVEMCANGQLSIETKE